LDRTLGQPSIAGTTASKLGTDPMKPVRQTLLEMILLTVAATAVALAGNTIRSGGHLKLGRNYFDRGTERTRSEAERPPSAEASTGVSASSTNPASTPRGADPASPLPAKHLDHPYQAVTFDEVVAILDDPNTARGVNLFVDARGDAVFAAGRIPGAIQLNHYELDKHLDKVLYRAQAAEKIVVYCNGGDCEDSIFVCTDLIDADIPYDNLYLYAGGWQEWSARETRIERGESTGGGG